MPDIIPLMLYPGVVAPLDATYTLSWGVTPGRATLSIAPQDLSQVEGTGDLTFADGENAVTLYDSQVVDATFGPGGSVQLILEDHRWRWLFPTVNGHYNQPAEQTQTVELVPQAGQPQGNPMQPPPPPVKGEEPINPWTRKNARELAKLCLDAMGERNYDVRALDKDATPRTDWVNENAAKALESLANDLGCVVCWRPDRRDVLVAKRGEGNSLPGGVHLDDSPSLSARPRPNKIVCLGAPTLYQMRFALEPVGLDFDGSIKPIDRLSYKPTNGWATSDPLSYAGLRNLQNLPGGRTGWDALALAQASVWRMYRIQINRTADEVGRGATTRLSGKPLVIPQGSKDPRDKIKRLEQIILYPFKNQVTKDDLGRKATMPAQCYGRHTNLEASRLDRNSAYLYENTTQATEVRVPFSVDAQHQLIIFSKPVYAHKQTGGTHPAEIVLECACSVLDPETSAPYRFNRELKLKGGLETHPAMILREDIQYRETVIYTDTNEVNKVEKNETESQKRADHYLRGEARWYELSAAQRKTWPAVKAVFIDGACQQVSWICNPGGRQFSTMASLNTEHDIYVPQYEARRRAEYLDLETVRIRKNTEAVERSQKALMLPTALAVTGFGGVS